MKAVHLLTALGLVLDLLWIIQGMPMPSFGGPAPGWLVVLAAMLIAVVLAMVLGMVVAVVKSQMERT